MSIPTIKKDSGIAPPTQNGTAIQRDRSSYLQKYQCIESWNLEDKERPMYHSLQWRFYKYRTLVPNGSLCQYQFGLTEEEKRTSRFSF